MSLPPGFLFFHPLKLKSFLRLSKIVKISDSYSILVVENREENVLVTGNAYIKMYKMQ